MSNRFDGTDDFSVNDRTLEFSQSLGTQMSGLSLSNGSSSGPYDSPSKFNNPATYSNHFEDRQISGSGQYDLTMVRNEFDIEEDFEEVVEAKEDKQ